jgi:hypothetical protein
MKSNNLLRKPIIFGIFGFVIIGYFIFQLNLYYEKTEIKKNKIEVIGKVTDQYRTYNLARYIRYEYTFEGKTYQDIKPLGDDSKNYLNKYFKVNISEAKPDFSIILLDEGVELP